MSDPVEKVFEKLEELDNRAMQTFIREIDREVLMSALKDSSAKTMEPFLTNMSVRARSIFQEEMERLTWIKPEDIRVARQKAIALLAQLVQKGALSLPSSIVLPDDSRIKTMGTRIEERIVEMNQKLDLLLKSVEDLKRKIN